MFLSGQDYIVIDGFSYLNPSDSLYIKLVSHEADDLFSRERSAWMGTCGPFTRNEIKGCEITAYAPGMPYDVGGNYAIGIQFADSMLIRSNYIHHWGRPTGDEQGGGEAVIMMSSTFCTVERNTIKYCAHGSILMQETAS